MRITGFSHCLFAIAAAVLALFSLAYGDFAAGGLTLPAWIPGREYWVYGSALLVLAASAGLCFSRTALKSALTIGAYLAAWAAFCVPLILAKPLSVDGWYGFCEALSSLVGAWILYTALEMPVAGTRGVRAAQILFGITCVFYGW
jgi:hypothetical protein